MLLFEFFGPPPLSRAVIILPHSISSITTHPRTVRYHWLLNMLSQSRPSSGALPLTHHMAWLREGYRTIYIRLFTSILWWHFSPSCPCVWPPPSNTILNEMTVFHKNVYECQPTVRDFQFLTKMGIMRASGMIASPSFSCVFSVPWLSFQFTWRSITPAVKTASLDHPTTNTDESTSALWSSSTN